MYQVTNTETVHEPVLIYGGPGTGKSTATKSITISVNAVHDDSIL